MLRSKTHKDIVELVFSVGCWTFSHTLCRRDKVALNALRTADYNSGAAADKIHLLKTNRPYELRYMQRDLQTGLGAKKAEVSLNWRNRFV